MNDEYEIPLNELLGRKLYLDLKAHFPNIALYPKVEDIDQYWANYTIQLPKAINTLSISDDNIYLYSYSRDNLHLLSIQIPYTTTNTLSIKCRSVLQHLIKELS